MFFTEEREMLTDVEHKPSLGRRFENSGGKRRQDDFNAHCFDAMMLLDMRRVDEMLKDNHQEGLLTHPHQEINEMSQTETEETAGQLLRRLGVDGAKWAEEMHKRFPQVPEDDLLGWCCNIIMVGYDHASGIGPVELPDGSGFFVGSVAAALSKTDAK